MDSDRYLTELLPPWPCPTTCMVCGAMAGTMMNRELGNEVQTFGSHYLKRFYQVKFFLQWIKTQY